MSHTASILDAVSQFHRRPIAPARWGIAMSVRGAPQQVLRGLMRAAFGRYRSYRPA